MGIANLCVAQMEAEGTKRRVAYTRIYLMDIDGLVTTGRHHMDKSHVPYAKDMPETKNLLEVSGWN